MAVIERKWTDGDLLELHLPMKTTLERWVENSVSVHHGPLVYVLKIGEAWSYVESRDRWGDFYEVRPTDPWNYGLLDSAVEDFAGGFEFLLRNRKTGVDDTNGTNSEFYPWSVENAPVMIRTKGKIIPDWKSYRHMAGPLPHSLPLKHLENEQPDEITLIPYGCSTLRITEFPVVR
jgi:hypothetical protein